MGQLRDAKSDRKFWAELSARLALQVLGVVVLPVSSVVMSFFGAYLDFLGGYEFLRCLIRFRRWLC
jgi:hypothetical protein